MNRFEGREGPIRLGMVGGGQGAMIGSVHRIAARLDGHFSLVAGALSSTPEKALASAREVGLPEDRTYTDYVEMAKREGVGAEFRDSLLLEAEKLQQGLDDD